jgi:hypothetical protein
MLNTVKRWPRRNKRKGVTGRKISKEDFQEGVESGEMKNELKRGDRLRIPGSAVCQKSRRANYEKEKGTKKRGDA